MKVAAIQMPTVKDKIQNIRTAGTYIEKIKAENPDFVILPEMFCCPYQTENFPVYAEKEGGPSWQAMSDYARKYHIYLIAGSMPEADDSGNVYNTSYIFDRDGKQIGKHRKAHLFDINVKNGQYFKESDTLTSGNHATVFDTEFGKMGVMICYDIRFPEFARTMALDGARMIFVPAAFNMTTGPAHWELPFLFCFVRTVSYFSVTLLHQEIFADRHEIFQRNVPCTNIKRAYHAVFPLSTDLTY